MRQTLPSILSFVWCVFSLKSTPNGSTIMKLGWRGIIKRRLISMLKLFNELRFSKFNLKNNIHFKIFKNYLAVINPLTLCTWNPIFFLSRIWKWTDCPRTSSFTWNYFFPLKFYLIMIHGKKFSPEFLWQDRWREKSRNYQQIERRPGDCI